MAVLEALAAASAVKEVVGSGALEAAKQIAQKVGTEGVERAQLMQSAMEQSSRDAQFRVNDLVSPDLERSEALAQKEVDAGEQLGEKIDKCLDEEVDERVQEGVSSDPETISYEIHTRNESLEGDRHPMSGVQFEKNTVEDAEGNSVTGVFAKFESTFDAQLPEDLYQASDKKQFAECNRQLADGAANDSELADRFAPEQLEQIKNGDTPDGYVWHHHEEKGRMQLVDSETHAMTGHTGGRSIWGGGSDFR